MHKLYADACRHGTYTRKVTMALARYLLAVIGLIAGLQMVQAEAAAPFDQSESNVDILRAKGCVKRVAANAYLAKQGGFALLRLDGLRVWDTGRNPAVDSRDLTYRFTLVVYNSDSGVRWVLTRSELPSDQEYSSLCIMASGLMNKSHLVNLSDAQWQEMSNIITTRPDDVLRKCEDLRPIMARLVYNCLEVFGGKTLPLEYTQILRESMLNGDNRPFSALLDEKRKAEERELERVKQTGDVRCDTPDKQIGRAKGAGTALVGQLVGEDTDQEIPNAVFSVLLSRNLHRWIIQETVGNGATVPYADGFKAELPDKGYEALFAH